MLAASKSIVLVVLIFVSSLAGANCLEEHVKSIGEIYKPDGNKRSGLICKIWPATGYLIVVSSVDQHDGADLDVMVFDPITNSVVGRIREVGVLSSDAIYNSGFSIDTGRYQLDDVNLAFGVRVLWKGSSQANPYLSESLHLYLVQDGEVVSVLNGLNVYERTGEWDTRCSGGFTTREMTMIMKPRIKSYADLLIKEKIVKTLSRQDGGVCRDVESESKTNAYALEYIKSQYVIPPSLRTIGW